MLTADKRNKTFGFTWQLPIPCNVAKTTSTKPLEKIETEVNKPWKCSRMRDAS